MSKTSKYNESATDIRDYPTPGANYRCKHYETQGLYGIAVKAYSNGKEWRRIWDANKDHARSTDPNKSFWVGDIVWIPGDPLAPIVEDLREDVPEFFDDVLDAFRLVVKGEWLREVVSARVVRSIELAADGWSAKLPFNPDNLERVDLYKPFAYHPSECYLGGKLAGRGTLYTVAPRYDGEGTSVSLECWSLCADMIDSTMSAPYEANNITLEKRARQLLDPLGIEVVWDAGEDKPFKRVTAEKTETYLEHLAKLAKQRGVQIMSTSQGRLLFTKIATGAPVDTLMEGLPPFTEVSSSFDGRARFSSYTALSSTPKKNKSANSTDARVPSSRKRVFTANEGDDADLQTSADWERSKAFADALTITFPVHSWYNSKQELWEPNTIVTVISPALMVPNGFDFLIKTVENIYEKGGTTAILTLVPPQVYTGEAIEDIWQ